MTYRELSAHLKEPAENMIVHGVPFHVARNAGCVIPIPDWLPVSVNAQVKSLFFLGMTTRARSGESGWAGERFFAYQRKLFLGDVLGRIDLLYNGNLMDAIPIIFGVNVWNYETFTPVQPHEAPVFPMFAPYREPLDSDPAARALFQESLILRENESGEKYTRYVFAFRPRQAVLEQVTFRPFGGRDAGFGVSAITALLDEEIEEGWRFTDHNFFMKKRYYPAVDRLARRLYQFRDELPQGFPLDLPDGYSGPHLELNGTPEAELLANVYCHNIHDMATQKVTVEGELHTSTRDAPGYGFYEGIGTYRQGHHNYYDQIWSRDLGRLLCELIEHGETERCVKAADQFLRYLYDPMLDFQHPHWKRIVNASELGIFPENYTGVTFQEFVKGRENDGHASVMLMFYRLYQHGCINEIYLRAHLRELEDAAEWFCWQMDTPAESGFDAVLCSESESTYEKYGGYDLFSNAYAHAALLAFARMAGAIGEDRLAIRWQEHAARLQSGMEKVFIGHYPRYGQVWCEPESDNWPSELKRLASLLLIPELDGYDPAQFSPETAERWMNTYKAQKEMFFSPMVGGSMGYGQGYTTQAALLLDQVEDYTECLNWAARFSYHHSEYRYIVPEGVTYHPSGRFWYRHTDLGNAVQQTEIIKCIRLVLGLDDLQLEAGLRLIPRLADGWQRIAVKSYPVAVRSDRATERLPVDWTYTRIADGYEARLTAEHPIQVNSIRFGPFPLQTERVQITGGLPYVLLRCGSRLFAYVMVDCETQDLQISATVSA